MADNNEKPVDRKTGQTISWVLYDILLIGAIAFIARYPWGLLGIPLFIIGLALLGSGLTAVLNRRRWQGVSLLILSAGVMVTGTILMGKGSVGGTLVAILLIPLGLFLLVYFVLAPKNIWFTFIEEGKAKSVMRADEFRKALIQWKGYILDEEWNVVEGEEHHLFGGLRFFGLWPLDYIHVYEFEWTGLKPDGITPLYHPPELLDYILLKQDVYFAVAKEAEDKERLPLNISFVLTIRIMNPYRALFRVQNWLETMLSRTIAAVRDKVSTETFERLIAKQAAIGGDIYRELSKGRGVFREFQREYGVSVLSLEILKIDPPQAQREATLKEFVAKQERKRIRVEASAERSRLITVAKGEAQRIETVYGKIRDFEALGRLIRGFEALETSPGEGAKWVILPGGMSDLASLWKETFGAEPPLRVSQEEIEVLKEVVAERKKGE